MAIPQNCIDKIIPRMLASKFDAQRAEIKTRESALAEHFYNQTITLEQRAALATLPQDWFAMEKCLQFTLGWRSITLWHASGLLRPRGSCTSNGRLPEAFDPDGSGSNMKRYTTLEREKNALEKAVREFVDVARGMLAGFASLQALAKGWPEGAQFYADLLPVKAGLPMVQTTQINTLLGLTPAKTTEPQP